jgi:RNA polymerase sigma factor FliA
MVYPRIRGHVAFDEVLALAAAGLAEAAVRFDPARGASFATFAWYRVRGTIIDGLRRSTQLPRRTWARLLALRAASDHPEPPGEAERGAAHPIAAVQTMYLLSLDALRDRGFDAAGDAPAPSDGLDRARTAARLRDAIARLPDNQRAIVTKHYFEGKNLLEAGAELGLSKSWASRLHAQAVARLRALIDGAEP